MRKEDDGGKREEKGNGRGVARRIPMRVSVLAHFFAESLRRGRRHLQPA